MSPRPSTTQPAASEQVRLEVDDQRALTALLETNKDPTVRLLVHLSQRQLDLFEILTSQRDTTLLLSRQLGEQNAQLQRILDTLDADLAELRSAVGLPARERPRLQVVAKEG